MPEAASGRKRRFTVQTPVFYGEHDVSVDEKGRLLVPADIRRCLQPEHGDAFFLIVGTDNRVPWLYPDAYYKFLVTQGKPSMTNSPAAMDYYRLVFSMADHLPIDRQGRILISARTLDKTIIGSRRNVCLLGVFDHIEIWLPEMWQSERESLISRSPDVHRRAAEAFQAMPR